MSTTKVITELTQKEVYKSLKTQGTHKCVVGAERNNTKNYWKNVKKVHCQQRPTKS
jgi:hypothetical protein